MFASVDFRHVQNLVEDFVESPDLFRGIVILDIEVGVAERFGDLNRGMRQVYT